MELRETLLTPEDFLNPKVGDTWVQGYSHVLCTKSLYQLLAGWFHRRADVMVFSELKHRLARRLGPAPDISVVMGLREDSNSDVVIYHIRATGIAPSLIIEVLAPYDQRIRRGDEVDKLEIYERFGIREYLLHDLPTKRNGWRMDWRGFRLDTTGRYAPIDPDAQGRLLSETTGLLFGADPTGQRAEIFDAGARQRLLSPIEIEEALRRETERCQQEIKARRVADRLGQP